MTYELRIVTFSPIWARTPMTEFSITEPRPMMQPSEIRLLVTVTPESREQGRYRGSGEDRVVAEGEVERRVVARQVDVRLVEGTDGPDVLPVAVEEVRLDPVRGDRLGEDLLAEVGGVALGEHLDEGGPVEQVDAHARQVGAALRP